MSTLKLSGLNSGSSIIKAPNSGSTGVTFTLPATAGTLATTTDVAARLPSITDNGDATAITIDSSENVGIGETTPLAKVHIKRGDSGLTSLNAAGDHIFLENTGANGTGITLASGNTSNGSIIFGDQDSNYRGVLIYDHSADAMKIVTAGSERMRIDSLGNVGISVTPDSELNTSYTNIQFGTGLLNQHDSYPHSVNLLANSIIKNSGTKQINTSYPSTFYQQWNGTHMFKVVAAGNAAITWTNPLTISQTGITPTTSQGHILTADGSGTYSRNFRNSTSETSHQQFYNPNGLVGKITTSGSGTSFTSLSDYRLKENVDYTWDATARLKQLKPARFNFIADDTNTPVDGFIAHEVSSIVPEAISGEKDAVDDDGNAVHQGIDQSKLVPLLVKTIQELEARITTLEG